MAEDTDDKGGIFRELGKLGADQQAILREIGNARTDVRERTDTIVKAVEAHVLDDKTKFDAHDGKFDTHDGRLKVLENWRWYILGLAGAAGVVFWFIK